MTSTNGPLAGRRILVTGASSGIGAATARAIVAAGGSVALLARRAAVLTTLAAELRDATADNGGEAGGNTTERADEAAPSSSVTRATDDDAAGDDPARVFAAAHSGRAPQADGGAGTGPSGSAAERVVVVPADVVDVEACRDAVEQAAAALGGLDGLVNAAGVLRPGSTLDGDPADWQLMLDVNVRGVLHVTSVAASHLRTAATARAGEGDARAVDVDARAVDVVNVSSMSGRRLGTTEMAVYAASKAAVHMLSEGMRRELAADGIRLAVISPGVVATGLFTGDDDTTAAMAAKATEAGLAAEDVAAAIVGLLAAPPHVVHDEIALRHLGQ